MNINHMLNIVGQMKDFELFTKALEMTSSAEKRKALAALFQHTVLKDNDYIGWERLYTNRLQARWTERLETP